MPEIVTLPPGCAELCPACPHRSLQMADSLQLKEIWARNKLHSYNYIITPINGVTEAERWHYRQKVCLSCCFDVNKWQIGVRKKKEVIDIGKCPVHNPIVNNTIRILKPELPSYDHFPLVYYLQSGRQVTLVLKTSFLSQHNWLTSDMKLELAKTGIEGLWCHLHPSAGRKVTGKGGWHLILGKPRSINDNGFEYGPVSFQQTTARLHALSLDHAKEYLSPDSHSAVVDLYCGTGSSLRVWAMSGASVIGVELNGEAVECAIRNVPEASILRGTCMQRIPQIEAWLGQQRKKTTLLYTNPPRTGVESELLNWIMDYLKPLRIAYLSCSTGTLLRDLNILCSKGYVVDQIIPYDFLPNTLHIECQALLRRQVEDN